MTASGDFGQPTVPIGTSALLNVHQRPPDTLRVRPCLSLGQSEFPPAINERTHTAQDRCGAREGSFAVLRPRQQFRDRNVAFVHFVAQVSGEVQDAIARHTVQKTATERLGGHGLVVDQDKVRGTRLLNVASGAKEDLIDVEFRLCLPCYAERRRVVAPVFTSPN